MAPLLEELTSYTALGPKLRKRKIDVDHIVSSMEGKQFGDLIDQVGFDAHQNELYAAHPVVFGATSLVQPQTLLVLSAPLTRGGISLVVLALGSGGQASSRSGEGKGKRSSTAWIGAGRNT